MTTNKGVEQAPEKILETEDIMLRFDQLEKNVHEISKQFRSIQQALNAIYEDRDMLTDVINEIARLRVLVNAADKKNEHLVQSVVETIERKTDGIQAEVHVTSHQIKDTIIQRVINGMTKSFRKERIALKVPWYKRLLFRRRLARVTV